MNLELQLIRYLQNTKISSKQKQFILKAFKP